MPRVVRNFWVDLTVDGKKAPVGTGPRSRTGGFRCKVLQRADGDIHHEHLIVEGIHVDGLLELKVWVDGDVIFKRTTKV